MLPDENDVLELLASRGLTRLPFVYCAEEDLEYLWSASVPFSRRVGQEREGHSEKKEHTKKVPILNRWVHQCLTNGYG